MSGLPGPVYLVWFARSGLLVWSAGVSLKSFTTRRRGAREVTLVIPGAPPAALQKQKPNPRCGLVWLVGLGVHLLHQGEKTELRDFS